MESIVDIAIRAGLRVYRSNMIHCPFHAEKTASCCLYEHDNSYHCFGCGNHGTALDLSRQLNIGIDVRDIVNNRTIVYRKLIEDIDMSIKELYSKIDSVLSITNKGIRYLNGRGVSNETINKFNIKSIDRGYKPYSKILGTTDNKILESSGLLSKKGLWMFYKDCIIFPHYFEGEIISFSNRNIDGEPKSFKLNGVPSQFYWGNKFNGDVVVLVEGQMDALSYYELTGLDNFLCTGGTTSMNKYLIKELLDRFNTVVVAFDNDIAGYNKASELSELDNVLVIDWSKILKVYDIPIKYKYITDDKRSISVKISNPDIDDWNTLLNRIRKMNVRYKDNNRRAMFSNITSMCI